MRRLFYTLASVFAIILVVIVAITARNTVEVRKTNTTLESGDNVKLEKLVVSEVTHSVFYAPQYVAINLGFFKEEGLDIELINGGGADKFMTAVLSNQVDIGFAGPEAAVYIYNEGKEDYAEVFAQVTKSTSETDAIEGNASPLKPNDEILKRLISSKSLLVACL